MAMASATFPKLVQATPRQPNSPAVRPQSLQVAGWSGAWRKLLSQAGAAAPHLQTAFIEGERGAGKQTLARCLHALSPLAGLPFQRDDARRWLAARTATSPIEGFIYVDNVDLLAIREQERLAEALKILHEQPRNRACFVASSRRSLQQLASQGMLVQELWTQLAVVRFAIPPLRFRREDIGALAHFLLDQACRRSQRPRASLGPGTLARMMQYSWPGNVRELANVIESALMDAREGIIRPEDLRLPSSEEGRPGETEPGRPSDLDLHTVIRRHVRHVLDLNRGNKLRSARQLGISRSTLYRILGNEAVLGR